MNLYFKILAVIITSSLAHASDLTSINMDAKKNTMRYKLNGCASGGCLSKARSDASAAVLEKLDQLDKYDDISYRAYKRNFGATMGKYINMQLDSGNLRDFTLIESHCQGIQLPSYCFVPAEPRCGAAPQQASHELGSAGIGCD